MNFSISSIALGRSICEAIRAVGDSFPTSHIELAIGALPDQENKYKVFDVIQDYKDKGITFSAHANFALHKHLNQERDFETIIPLCEALGIDHYSIHAPLRSKVDDFEEWVKEKYYFAQEHDIQLSIETMYPRANQPYWLDNVQDCDRLLSLAYEVVDGDWVQPLLVDLAHLQICINSGTWTNEQVLEYLGSCNVSEVHYSDNDGINDVHKPYIPGTNTLIDFWMDCINSDILCVNEGRYSKINTPL